jgi:hypothetical protein
MLKQSRLFYGLLCTLLFVLLAGTIAQAQVVPDTTHRKPELPTGPPMPAEQPRPQPRPVEPPEQEPTVDRAPEKGRDKEAEQEDLRLIDRLYTGGSFGLQFGTYTNISLLPILGYRVTDKFSIGAGAVYHFSKYNRLSFSSYGARGFTQLELFNIGEGAVLGHAEVEYLNTKYEDAFGNISEGRKNLALPLVGVGYRQRLGTKASVDMLLLYNMNENVLGNPYNNPVFRVGFNVPFTSR